MKLKDEVIRILEENRGKSVSGTEIANQLYVTRGAVWKAIKALQKQGYEIDAVTNRGYLLKESNDIVSVNALIPHLTGPAKNFNIEIKKTVTSTNTLLKEAAVHGISAGSVLIANEQTEGRGRLGKNFYSPASTGIYLSILLRPQISATESLLLTTSAAVAVCRAIESVSKKKANIKWINDIFIQDKKVCGILSEASINCELNQIDYAVVGIGLNVTTKKFPKEIEEKAGSVYDQAPTKHPVVIKLITSLLNELGYFSEHFMEKEYLEEYKRRLLHYDEAAPEFEPLKAILQHKNATLR